jgi:hypothetical protein
MADGREGLGPGLLALLAVGLCCGLPAVMALGAGAFAVVGGFAARYWPITVVGVLAAAWGCYRAIRVLQGRGRTRRDRDASRR